MASSGYFNATPGYKGRYLVFSWEIQSQNIANNTTTIKWSLKGAGGSSVDYMVQNVVVTIDGKTVYTLSVANQKLIGNGDTVTTGTYSFSHNDDGTRSFSASVEAGIYNWSPPNAEGSATFTLDTIARASQPSLVTWPETTNDVGYFGEEFSIHMNRKSSAFTHTVRYEYGDRAAVIARNVETGTTWTVPLDFMNDIPNATSASGRIYVDTYNGSTFVGTKYTGFAVKVPDSVKPTCTVQVLDETGIMTHYGNLVKGLSKLTVNTNGYPAYSSPIASYNVTANGAKYTAKSIITDVLKDAGTTTVTATVMDKRGRTSAQASVSFPVLDYAHPTVPKVTAVRCNEDGTANRRGDHVKVIFSALVTSLNNKNSALYYVYYKKSSDSTYTKVSMTDITNVYSVTNKEYIFAANKGKSYDVMVEVVDRHGSNVRSAKAPTAFAILSWRGFKTSQGTEDGLGIGMIPEKPNTLQIAYDTEFRGKVSGLLDAIYPINSIYISYSHTYPGDLFGGVWVRIENRFLWGCDEDGGIGTVAGEKTVTLTAKQIPSHNHGGTYTNAGTAAKTHSWLASGGSNMTYDTVNTGGGEAHNNMPPYIQVSIWRRIE